MKCRLPLCAFLLAFTALPALGQETIAAEGTWIETTASRYVSPQHEAAEAASIAKFGPFRVLDQRTIALVDVTGGRAPHHFARLLKEFPHIEAIHFVEAPGTDDDLANLRLGRMIREHGIATIAPEGGSIRSGAVELFLAGLRREIHDDSEFAVHGWLDERGFGADDYPADAPEHTRYLTYYVEMGMSGDGARAFYAMTNSVPFEQARWLTGLEMQGWIGDASANGVFENGPELAYADLSL